MKRLLSLLCLMGIMFAFQTKLNAGDTYLVIYDMDKTEWKYRYTDDPPDLTKDACRTTELWLRKIPAGSFTMGSPEDEIGYLYALEDQHPVTITKPFYIGVFECTQRQWELVMGERPECDFDNDTYYATRPVDGVSYYELRGEDVGAEWPVKGHAVDMTSFIGMLRGKTGLALDLPTEAQWEYACRAGTTTALNSGENLTSWDDENLSMNEVGRYKYNGGQEAMEMIYNTISTGLCDTTIGTNKVGSYRPNAWGLYDMHGNVMEWCLDWFASYDTAVVEDPVGPNEPRITETETIPFRVLRGGGWRDFASICRSGMRWNEAPAQGSGDYGVRVVFLPDTYVVSVVNGTPDKVEPEAGETVTVRAGTPAIGEMFDKWVSDDVVLTDANALVTTFTMPAGKSVTVTATFKKTTAQTYLVIYDMDKTDWKYRFTDTPPNIEDDVCRTTELWLRQIPAGSFMMGSPEDEIGYLYMLEDQHPVTITKPFYIGVFEFTQRQWELVMRERPECSFDNEYYYATRPVELLSYNELRGENVGAEWPKRGHAVDMTSFLGVFRAKTGLAFDLPTEAQWEYACRAGTTTALNSGENLTSWDDENLSMNEVGRYKYNGGQEAQEMIFNTMSLGLCNTTIGTAKVGSYRPNAWGLYDMHGNVMEWCLDWFAPYDIFVIDGEIWVLEDPEGPDDPIITETETRPVRVLRGGGWRDFASICRSGMRWNEDPAQGSGDYGFRVALMPKVTAAETYAVTVVDGTADKTSATAGETITITADAPAAGKVFDKWTGEGVVFADATAATTTFEMPAASVTVTATYKAIRYAVTVVDGTADKAAAVKGETVTITADAPAEGKEFDKWVGKGVVFADASSEETTFVMPAKDVTVTATYKDTLAAEYTVTVVNGVADKATAAKGDVVTITADDRLPSHDFLRWTTSTNGVKFASKLSAETTFVMPAKDVTVTATYKVLPKYTVKVTKGVADKATAYAGETVTITADAPAAGKQFSKWTFTGSGITFENANAAETTFVMPKNSVWVKANFTAAP